MQPLKGGSNLQETVSEPLSSTESNMELASSEGLLENSFDEYAQLQLSIYKATLAVAAFAVLITAMIFGLEPSISLLVGALSGLLYLRLLARSVGKLGKSSKVVNKIQLLVPVLLVLAVSRLPQLDLLPALLGFLLYKPSLIIQFLFDSRSRAEA